jgi:hypothetical protein
LKEEEATELEFLRPTPEEEKIKSEHEMEIFGIKSLKINRICDAIRKELEIRNK